MPRAPFIPSTRGNDALSVRTGIRALAVIFVGAGLATGADPKVLDERLELDLIAAEPAIVTPTGIACDERGRLFVIESHTHFRPKDYSGPGGDRIRLLVDADGDGTFEKITNFAEGLRLALGMVLDGPQRVYVITRSALLLIADTDDDGRADEQTCWLASKRRRLSRTTACQGWPSIRSATSTSLWARTPASPTT